MIRRLNTSVLHSALVNGTVYCLVFGPLLRLWRFITAGCRGVPINTTPSNVTAWATSLPGGGGIWGHGGPASAPLTSFVVTGNTFDTFRPLEWRRSGDPFTARTGFQWETQKIIGCLRTGWTLDDGDTDLGGCGPVLDHWSTARRLRSWCLHWAKMVRRICLTEITSAALERLLRLRRWLLLFEDKRLPRIAPGRAHILFFVLPAALFALTDYCHTRYDSSCVEREPKRSGFALGDDD